MIRRPPRSPPFPSPTLFRPPQGAQRGRHALAEAVHELFLQDEPVRQRIGRFGDLAESDEPLVGDVPDRRAALVGKQMVRAHGVDRKSTRLNSSHGYISYAVF